MSEAVLIRPLDGQWEQVGVDRHRGILPEGITFGADDWGPVEAGYELRRDPRQPQADHAAYTPAEVWIEGVPCFLGDVIETPSRGGSDRALGVRARGRQGNLDDDVYDRLYVHSRLGDWVDARAHPSTPTTFFTPAEQVEAEGAILLAHPDGTAGAGNVGVLLDCGEGGADRLVVTYRGGASGAPSLLALAGDSPADFFGSGASVTIDAAPVATTSTTFLATFSRAYRYLAVVYSCPGAGGSTSWVQLSSLIAARQSSYIASNVSALSDADLFADVITKAPLIGQGTTKITESASPKLLPHLTTEGQSSPREVVERGLLLERRQASVTIENEPRLRDRPTAPLFEVGEWPGHAEFEDASLNSGEDVYNAAVIEGDDVSGTALASRREAAQVTGLAALSRSQVTENDFEGGVSGTNVANWTFSQLVGAGGSFQYLTTTTPSGSKVGSIWAGTTSGNWVDATATVTGLVPGRRYTLTFYAKKAFITPNLTPAVIVDGTSVPLTATSNVWGTYSATFRAASSGTLTILVRAQNFGAAGVADRFYVDGFTLYTASNLAERAGFVRAQIVNPSGPLSTTEAQTVADAFLRDHVRTPFRGALAVTGPDAVRWVKGGHGVPPHVLPRHVGEKIRIGWLHDPDTGDWGRDVYIADANYERATRTCRLTLDNTSTRFDRALAKVEAG